MTKSTIEEIAGKFLGKTADGASMMRYETPTQIDPSLLVGIPRSLNRESYGITDETFNACSYDMWNCYEFSYLRNGNIPINGRLHIAYPARSPNIVESKSLKLYLNSFNLAQITHDVDPCDIIKNDLGSVLGVNSALVFVKFAEADTQTSYSMRMPYNCINLERSLVYRGADLNITNLSKEDPDLLTTYDRGWSAEEAFYSTSLRSNCRVTNQPDWGDLFVSYESEKSLSPVSLYKYIVSLRSENHFHEEIAECIYKRLQDVLTPTELMVVCLYTRRGGIDINPVRVSSQAMLDKYEAGLERFADDGQYPLYRSPRQ